MFQFDEEDEEMLDMPEIGKSSMPEQNKEMDYEIFGAI